MMSPPPSPSKKPLQTMTSQDSDYQIQQPKPQSRVVLAGSLEARSGKKWKMRRVELLGSGELLLRGKRNATRYLLDGRCTVSAVEARVSDKGLHSFSVSWPAGAYTPTPIPNRLQSKKKLGESSDSEDEGPRVREIDAELRQKKKLTKKHRAGKGMLATAATATTVVAGGVVIGVATMGIGLVPYAVGIAGLAGGGAAYLKSSEKELHLELGSRDKKLADRWRSLIEDMVARRAAALDLAAGVETNSSTETSRLVARPDRAVVLRRSRAGTMATSSCRRVVRAPPLRLFVALLGGERGCWAAHHGCIREVQQLAARDDRSDVAVLQIAGLAPPSLPVAEWFSVLKTSRSAGDVMYALWGLSAAFMNLLVSASRLYAPFLVRPCVFLASLTATRPRACVVARTWRVDDDGAFLVRLEPAAPPPGARVKGIRTQLCAVLAVAPHADDQLKSEGDEEYEPERALVSARVALVDGGGWLAPGRGWVPSSLRAAAQRLVADAVALSVGDLADAWEHDIASINEPEDEDASFEREALRARATPPSVSQRKVSIGGERARLEKIVVEKQGAERRAAVLQLQRLLRTADGLTTAASLGSFDDTEDDDLALAEPQSHERRALAALAAGLWARHPAARRRADARSATRASTSGADDRRAWRLVPVASLNGGVGGDDDFVATVLGVVGVSAVAYWLAG